jgi:hypothetical protein
MAITSNPDFLRAIRTPAYAFLGVNLIFQVSGFLLGVMPFTLGSAMWRFSFAGAFAGNVGNILMLLLLLFAVSLQFSDRVAITIVGVFAALGTLILFGGAVSFALDALQLRGRVDLQVIRRFDVGAAETLLKYLVQGAVSLLLSMSAYRAYRAVARGPQRVSSHEGVFVGLAEARTSKSRGAEFRAPASAAEGY